MKKILFLLAFATIITACSRTGYVKKDGKLTYQYYAGGDFEVSNRNIIGVDETSFKSINEQYGKDKKSVFYKGFKIPNADPATFEILFETMAKDKNYVFEDSIVVKDADPQTYVHIEEEFFKDKNAVFLKGALIPLMDSKTFEIIDFPYVKDKNHIYCGTVPLQIKDKASFKVTNNGGLRLYEDTELFSSINPEFTWMNTTKSYYPIFYVDDATAKTDSESFKNFKLIK
jgi:hypothetical protein